VTTREKLKKMLTDRGLFDDQAEAIMAVAIPKIESLTPSKVTWDSPADDYPKELYGVMWLPLRDTAREWIKENAPHAWFRPAFD